MLKIEDIKTAMQAARKSAMIERLNLNGKTNWLQADSDAVLLEVADAYHDALTTIDSEPGMDAAAKVPLIDAAKAEFLLIAHLLTNPSALRQTLVSQKKITPPADTNKRSNKAASLVADL